MLIGTVAARSGLSRDTLRFYEKIGLISAQRRANGYKEYAPITLDQLQLIQLAKQLGFRLQDIKEILPLLQSGGIPTALLQEQIAQKIQLIDQQMAQLASLRQMLVDLPLGQDCPLQQHCVAQHVAQQLQPMHSSESTTDADAL